MFSLLVFSQLSSLLRDSLKQSSVHASLLVVFYLVGANSRWDFLFLTLILLLLALAPASSFQP